MGLSYTAEAFFGTYVEEASPLYKKLRRAIDRHKGTPAPTKVPGVELDIIGAWNGSPMWIVVRAAGDYPRFSRDAEIAAPSLLVAQPEWPAKIRAFLDREGVPPEDLPPIGWYFGGSVS